MDFDVFISYSSKDKIAADGVCATLERSGIRCWIAPRDIVPGKEYGEAIVEALDNCRVVVLIFSSNANSSNQISREIERAVSRGVPVIPLRIEDVPPTKSMAYFVGSIHWFDALNPPLEPHFQRLSITITSLLNAERGKTDQAQIRLAPQEKEIALDETGKFSQASAARLPASRWILAGGALVIVAVLAVVAWFGFSPHAPPPITATSVLIQSHPDAGKKCLDVPGSQFIPGVKLIVYECIRTPNQLFTYENQQITIGGFCVDALGGAGQRGDVVGLWPCSGQANQNWTITPHGDYFELIGINQLCLDITGGFTTNGTPLELYPCHGQANQLWAFRPL